MHQPTRAPPLTSRLVQQQHAEARGEEDRYAHIHGERIVEHEQRTAEEWRNHSTSVGARVSAQGRGTGRRGDVHPRERRGDAASGTTHYKIGK